MSIENIGGFVRKLLQEDDSLTAANDCRNSVTKIIEKVNNNFPDAEKSVLVYPEASEGNGVHYAALFSRGKEQILVNAVPAPGFPEYIGDPDKAPLPFNAMKKAEKVI